MGIVHSEAFDVYPWFPAPDMDGRLHVLTPAVGGSHLVERLRPRPTPALGTRSLAVSQIDRPLLGAIVARWERCFANGNESTEDRRLFRALEMARAASKTPGGADASEHDAGRSVALWVSAFEILVHDGRHADLKRVLPLARQTLRLGVILASSSSRSLAAMSRLVSCFAREAAKCSSVWACT
jgi:hypothetical protein